jgi:hypothetical protein
MSVRVMSQVWEIDIPAKDKLVLLALADCASDEGLAWPSIATLARKCSRDERTVQRNLRELESAGHITREEVAGRGCRYRVHPRQNATPGKMSPVTKTTKTPGKMPPHPRQNATQSVKEPLEPSKVKSSDDDPLTIDELVSEWNDLADDCGLPRVAKLTDSRKRRAVARLRQYPDVSVWQRAFANIRGSPWLRGLNDRGWRADFDFILQDKSFTKLIEGSYGTS